MEKYEQLELFSKEQLEPCHDAQQGVWEVSGWDREEVLVLSPQAPKKATWEAN